MHGETMKYLSTVYRVLSYWIRALSPVHSVRVHPLLKCIESESTGIETTRLDSVSESAPLVVMDSVIRYSSLLKR